EMEIYQRLLQEAGFSVVDRMLYDGFKGLKDEVSPLRLMFKWPILGQYLQRRLRSWKWAERNLGHMILFVCRKAQ
ncbi:unnamed protein product, partial [marine sediment metagenome]